MTTPGGFHIDTDGVHAHADRVAAAGRLAGAAWDLVSGAIANGPAAIGPPDRLASAFYSGYTRRAERWSQAGGTLPGRFAERAGAAHASAEIYFTAELRATGGFLG